MSCHPEAMSIEALLALVAAACFLLGYLLRGPQPRGIDPDERWW